MMVVAERWQQIKSLVDKALDAPVGDRLAFLERACGDDSELREATENLLARDALVDGFLEKPFFSFQTGDGSLDDSPEDLDLGRRVGPYRLVRRLGHGGMGVVYLAERVDEELKQRVAVKLLKRGLDTEELVRRFQMERQILASMDHPAIARLLDGGALDDGRPFIVMEYVDGETIDVYCKRVELGLREKVALFRKVCEAVQFAHRNLVVHRDLKPSNILVAADGGPKLLDFGIAKLLDRDTGFTGLTARTGSAPLSFNYASPEQISGGNITTATDVYGLGVVLYELLAGQCPHDQDGLSTDEMIRKLREGIPLKPSEVAPGLDCDLDNIALMALRPDPQDRFVSAEQLSEDLRRFLEGMPVRSRPASWRYRTGKFVRRHTAGVAAVVLFVLVVAAFSVGVSIQAQSVARERDVAQQALSRAEHERERAEGVKNFLIGFLTSVDPSRALGEEPTVRQALDLGVEQLHEGLVDQPEIRASLLDAIGIVYRHLGESDEALEVLEEALALRLEILGKNHLLVAESMHNLALAYRDRRILEKAEQLIRQAVRIQSQSIVGNDRELAAGLNNLALLLFDLRNLDEAEGVATKALAMKEKLFGESDLELTTPLNTLARIRRGKGALEEAEDLYMRSLHLRRMKQGGRSPDVADSLNALAGVLIEQCRFLEASLLYEEALDIRRDMYKENHSRIATVLCNLGNLQARLGNVPLARRLIEECLDMSILVENGRRARVAERLLEELEP